MERRRLISKAPVRSTMSLLTGWSADAATACRCRDAGAAVLLLLEEGDSDDWAFGIE
ncbi:hypothetical protein ACHAXH_003048 [Discostella pseudostelligera]